MERLPMILILALSLSFFSGCQTKEITQEERAENERKVDELQSRFSQAFAARDLSALVSLYADNGALYYEDHPIIRGKNAIRDTWKNVFDRQDVIVSTLQGSVEISNTGDLAWAHGTIRIGSKVPGAFPQYQSRYTLIYKSCLKDGKYGLTAPMLAFATICFTKFRKAVPGGRHWHP